MPFILDEALEAAANALTDSPAEPSTGTHESHRINFTEPTALDGMIDASWETVGGIPEPNTSRR